jgi:hypothetical protein
MVQAPRHLTYLANLGTQYELMAGTLCTNVPKKHLKTDRAMCENGPLADMECKAAMSLAIKEGIFCSV